MYSEVNIIGIIFFLAWIGIGIWLSYYNRKASCGIKILLFIVCTKGFLLFWIPYFPYLLIKNFKEGMKEGNIEQQQKDKNDSDI